MKPLKLKPGIHKGIPFAEYCSIEAVSNSQVLRHFCGGNTSAHAHWAMTHPEKDTDALRLGDAAHAAILEPKRFAARYVAAPQFDKRTNAGKLAAEKWAKKYAKFCPLTEHEYAEAEALRDAAWGNPLARKLLSSPGQNELTVIWKDKTTGLLCKCRLDRFTAYQRWPTIVDVKTTREKFGSFERECAKFAYHRQAAFYLDGLNTLEKGKYRFFHIVIEKFPPYLVACGELGELSLREGRAQYLKAISTYAQCKLTGKWPGHPAVIVPLEIPNYAFELVDPKS